MKLQEYTQNFLQGEEDADGFSLNPYQFKGEKMGLIRKVEDFSTYKQNMTSAELLRIVALEKELTPSEQLVILGTEKYLVGSFDMSESISYSKLQSEYRDVLKDNPNITFSELVSKYNIIQKILDFLQISTDVSSISYKQWKYLLWTLQKNYVFTSTDDSDYINQMSPFFFV